MPPSNETTTLPDDSFSLDWPRLTEILQDDFTPTWPFQAAVQTSTERLGLLESSTNTQLTFTLDAPASDPSVPGESLYARVSDEMGHTASASSPSAVGNIGRRPCCCDSVLHVFADKELATTDEEGLKCKWPGCRSSRTFKRKYEYNRHMKKHTRTISLPCPVVYCPRQGSRAFYRWDKLFDHLRTGHTEDEPCKCLVDGCTTTQMPLNLLRLHARHHDIDINKHPNLATSYDFLKVLRSFSMARKCDLKKCKRWIGADGTGYLQQHLRQHSLEDRRSQSDVIKNMGYDPTTAEIICPLCQKHFADSAQFIPHLETTHLATNSYHWLTFKRHVLADSPTTTRYIWRGWENKDGSSEDCYCTFCNNYASSQSSSWIDHHLGLLVMSDDIKAVRARILRLLPEFADHPIFETDMPTVHRAR